MGLPIRSNIFGDVEQRRTRDKPSDKKSRGEEL